MKVKKIIDHGFLAGHMLELLTSCTSNNSVTWRR